jgi:hypothetical protein
VLLLLICSVLKAKAPPVAPKGSARDAVRKRTTTTATAKTKPNGAADRRRSFSTLRTSLASGDAALWGPVVSGAIGGDFRRPDTLSLSNSGGVTWTGAMDWALPVRCGSRLVDAVQRYRSNPWTSVDQTVARRAAQLALGEEDPPMSRYCSHCCCCCCLYRSGSGIVRGTRIDIDTVDA